MKPCCKLFNLLLLFGSIQRVEFHIIFLLTFLRISSFNSSSCVEFQDFECDVQMEGSESGEERKEFSFTFYDLDGHGKITKDVSKQVSSWTMC